ncbi:hypothetical protein BC629DRAFT_1596603 [Irpex lacteus]|nr:hypothetical protein BC629DRAFT_1596603 [Irpex lacteus]
MRFTFFAIAVLFAAVLPASSAPIPAPSNEASGALSITKGITGVFGELSDADAPVYVGDAHDRRDARVEDPDLLHIIYSNAPPPPVVGGTESGALEGPSASGHSKSPGEGVSGTHDKREARVEDPDLLHIIYSNAPPPPVVAVQRAVRSKAVGLGHSKSPGEGVSGTHNAPPPPVVGGTESGALEGPSASGHSKSPGEGVSGTHDKREARVEDPDLLRIIYSNAPPPPVVGGTESGALEGPSASGHSKSPGEGVSGTQ